MLNSRLKCSARSVVEEDEAEEDNIDYSSRRDLNEACEEVGIDCCDSVPMETRKTIVGPGSGSDMRLNNASAIHCHEQIRQNLVVNCCNLHSGPFPICV
jgi:hypothetical protein